MSPIQGTSSKMSFTVVLCSAEPYLSPWSERANDTKTPNRLQSSLLSLCGHDVCHQINIYHIIISDWLTLWIKLKFHYSPIITFFFFKILTYKF